MGHWENKLFQLYTKLTGRVFRPRFERIHDYLSVPESKQAMLNLKKSSRNACKVAIFFIRVYGMVKFNKSQWKSRKASVRIKEKQALTHTHPAKPGCATGILWCYITDLYTESKKAEVKEMTTCRKNVNLPKWPEKVGTPLPHPRGFKGGHMT